MVFFRHGPASLNDVNDHQEFVSLLCLIKSWLPKFLAVQMQHLSPLNNIRQHAEMYHLYAHFFEN